MGLFRRDEAEVDDWKGERYGGLAGKLRHLKDICCGSKVKRY